MAKIHKMRDYDGAQFYPEVHEKAVVDSNGVTLDTKLDAIVNRSFKEAWDGGSTPVVAEIPAGVVVTYNSQSYTGTLAASAATAPFIYMVADGNGNYDRYVSELSGSSYVWKYYGNTEIDLADYATKEELAKAELIAIDSNLYKFESGTISSANAESANDKRVRSNYIPARKDYIIACAEIYQFSLRYYDEKGLFISSSGTWVTKLDLATQAPVGTAQFRIVARLASDGTISDPTSFNSYIKIYYPAQTFLAENVALKEQLDGLYVKRLEYDLRTGYIVDCRTENSNFGKVISQSNWGVSQFVDVQNVKYVRLYRNISSTATNPSYSGIVFYDKDQKPMTEGVERIFYGTGGTAFADWTIHKVPAGAVWFRVGVSVVASTAVPNPIELYAISPKEVVGFQSNGYTKRYEGERVNLESNAYELRSMRSIAGGSQSAAIYGKYVFFLNDGLQTVVLWDALNNVTLYTLTTGLSPETILHCNQSQFGRDKYDEGDLFPLLYTCATNNDQGRCEWRAYRIVPTLSNGEITSFTITLVQTIYLPIMSDQNSLGNANPAFDLDRNCIWAYSRNNEPSAQNYLRARFSKFAIPAIFDGGGSVIPTVTLSDSDILDAFDADFSMQYAQGAFIASGKLYMGQGGPTYPYNCLRVIDLYAQRRQVTLFDLAAAGFNDEPEGVFQYAGHIWVHTNSGRLYRLDLN